MRIVINEQQYNRLFLIDIINEVQLLPQNIFSLNEQYPVEKKDEYSWFNKPTYFDDEVSTDKQGPPGPHTPIEDRPDPNDPNIGVKYDKYGQYYNPVVGDNTNVVIQGPQGPMNLGTTTYVDWDADQVVNTGKNIIDFIASLDIHDWLDIAAMIAIWIPVYGWAVALVLEGINATIFLYQGNKWGAALSFAFMFAPALGPVFRRLTSNGVKAIARVFKNSYKLHKSGATEKIIKEQLEKDMKRLTPQQVKAVEYIYKHSDDFMRMGDITKKEFKEILKTSDEWLEHQLKYYKGWRTGSKFLMELMNPKMFEKIMYGVAIAGMIYLDKSGKLQIGIDKLLSMWPSANKEAVKKNLEQVVASVNDIDFESKTEEERKQIQLNFVKNISKTIQLAELTERKKNMMFDEIFIGLDHNTYPTIEDKEKLIQLYKSNHLFKMDTSQLRSIFSQYSWGGFCERDPPGVVFDPLSDQGNESIDASDGISLELDHDKTWKYKLIAGLWYTRKKNGTTDWKLVKDCGANLALAIAHEKKSDPDIDTGVEWQEGFYKIVNKENISHLMDINKALMDTTKKDTPNVYKSINK